ncbi:MAG: hypothetical protein ACLFVW_05605 [Phycisphaerae bacterium]
MPHESDSAAASPVSAVRACSADVEAKDMLRRVYARADAELARHAPVCRACGQCCRFAKAGHRLLVSPLELAVLTEASPEKLPVEPGICPYQHNGLCTARERRPLGCRVFFCQAPLEECSRLYELYHRNIRRLHAERQLAYVYAELTIALSQLLNCNQAGQNAQFTVDTNERYV